MTKQERQINNALHEAWKKGCDDGKFYACMEFKNEAEGNEWHEPHPRNPWIFVFEDQMKTAKTLTQKLAAWIERLDRRNRVRA